MGRKRKPTHMHLVQGTFQKCRHGRPEPTPESEPPRAPTTLSHRATEIFGRLVGWLQPIGMASATDTEMLALLASTLEEKELLDENIRINGLTYAKIELIEVPDLDHPGQTITKAQKIWKANPAIRMRADAMKRAHSLLAEFGLSPASRARLGAGSGGGKPDRNPWDDLV